MSDAAIARLLKAEPALRERLRVDDERGAMSDNDARWDDLCDDIEKCEAERHVLRQALDLALEICAETVPAMYQIAPAERVKRIESDYAILKRLAGEIALMGYAEKEADEPT